MTYKLEPWIEKIQSEITMTLPDGTQKRYISGSVAAADIFEKHYVVKSVVAIGGAIMLALEEADVPATGWFGEEQQSFF